MPAEAASLCERSAKAGSLRIAPSKFLRTFSGWSLNHRLDRAARLGAFRAHAAHVNLSKSVFVYVLRSETDPRQRYIGRTADVVRRLREHNRDPIGHTRRYRPWQLEVVREFADTRTAARFERYLKTGSGRAFAWRHFRKS